MAESGDVSEKAEKKNINIMSAMDTIDKTILHHLDKLDSTAKGDVLDSLMTDFEKDTLKECREVIFCICQRAILWDVERDRCGRQA